jgi:hypothetical protein
MRRAALVSFASMSAAEDRLKIESTEESGVLRLKLVGVVDELANLDARVPPPRGRALAGVKWINSRGVKTWIEWLAKVEAGQNKVRLFECSPAVVSQINMIDQFTGRTTQVVSFQAPYYCPSCHSESRVILETARLGGNPPPTPPCGKCGAPLELDEIADAFFAFVASHAQRP